MPPPSACILHQRGVAGPAIWRSPFRGGSTPQQPEGKGNWNGRGFLLRHPLPALAGNLLTKGNFCQSQIFRPSYQACISSCPSLLEPVDLRGDTILCHSTTSSAVFGSVHVVSPADAHFVRSSTHPESSRCLIRCTALPIFDAVSPSHLHFIWRMLDFWCLGHIILVCNAPAGGALAPGLVWAGWRGI